MTVLEKINEEFIGVMKKEPGVCGAWEFGSGMHGNKDKYSDIDIVFLVAPDEFQSLDGKLKSLVSQVCDTVHIFWGEDFNNDKIKNYGCILERDDKLVQYDIFLLNQGEIRDPMCQLHYRELKKENIFFDTEGEVAKLIDSVPMGEKWSADLERLIETYWLHMYMCIKYICRKDYFKLQGVVRILQDTHASLLLCKYDNITWGGTANKLNYINTFSEEHLKEYYCSRDIEGCRINLEKSMKWFIEDVGEVCSPELQKKNEIISDKLILTWADRLILHRD